LDPGERAVYARDIGTERCENGLPSAGEQYEGGALRIYQPEPLDITPKAGTLVAFRSDMPHEVLTVTAGVRDVVVDWFF